MLIGEAKLVKVPLGIMKAALAALSAFSLYFFCQLFVTVSAGEGLGKG